MARKVGQIIRRGARAWLVRVYNGRDSETKKRKYLNQTVYCGLRDAQAHLNKMLGERDRGRNLDSSKQTLNEFLDRWLELCAKPWLRAKSIRDYEGLLRRYVRPVLGANALATYLHWISRRSTATCWTDTCRLVRFAIRTLSSGRRSSRPSVGISFWGIPQMPSISPCSIGAPLPYCSLQQTRTFVKAIAGHAYEGLLALAMTTGMRPSEYLALTRNDIDLHRVTAGVSRSLEWRKGGWQFADTKRPRSRRVGTLRA